MHKSEPYISSFDEGIEQIKQFGKPSFHFYISHGKAIVLKGGSIKHPVILTLYKGSSVDRSFGNYRPFEVLRLIVNDAGYRTKYWIEKEEYEMIRQKMREFAHKRDLSLHCHSRIYNLNEYHESINKDLIDLGYSTPSGTGPSINPNGRI